MKKSAKDKNRTMAEQHMRGEQRPAMTLYFAYGSNMAAEQMESRCPESKRLGTAVLQRYRWIISTRGYANIVCDASQQVEGILYQISKADERRLDGYEGVDSGGYRKRQVEVWLAGCRYQAMVYVDPVVAEGAPKKEYIARMKKAVQGDWLSADYIQATIRAFIPEEEVGADKEAG